MALHHCLFMIGNEGGVPDKSSLKIDESSVGLFFYKDSIVSHKSRRISICITVGFFSHEKWLDGVLVMTTSIFRFRSETRKLVLE